MEQNYYMKTIIFTLILGAVSPALLGAPQKKTKIKMLTWWDYIAPEVIDRLKHDGYDPEIVTYRSNDVAISRLGHNQENFDVAVISSTAVDVLRDSLPHPKEGIGSGRAYEKIFDDLPKSCVPYFWGTSVFSFTKGQEKTPITSIRQLVAAKANGFEIGVIDDALELASRIRDDEHISVGDFFVDRFRWFVPTRYEMSF